MAKVKEKEHLRPVCLLSLSGCVDKEFLDDFSGDIENPRKLTLNCIMNFT